jgi:predicted RNase H-like HicB family nuclease
VLDSLNLERYSVYLYIEEDKKYFVMAEEVPLNEQKEDNYFINLKDENDC